MSHGVIQARNMREARMIPARERLLSFQRRYQIQSPEAGRKASNEVFVRAAMPQISPNSSHGFQSSFSSITSVSQKSTASKSAARLVSHTQRVHQYVTDGRSAHVQELQTATFSLKHRFAIKKIGIPVRAEKMLLMVSRINADA